LRLTTLRARSVIAVVGALLSLTITVAVAAAAQSDTDQSTQTTPTAQAASGPVATKASSAIALDKVRRHVVAGRRVVVVGELRPRGAGRVVELRVGRHVVDRDRTGARGRFLLRWKARNPGSRSMRVVFKGSPALTAAKRRIGRANIYRRAVASWYGPGLYGNHLACGGRLSPGTLGVAHKSLPCGSRVTLRYRGHTVRVPVVDRGPYVGGREFDLTYATKSRLHFGSTGVVLTTR
jgi:rare lipoprotein A (peptidoglycan hydrolase)